MLARLFAAALIVLCLELGFFLLVIPWTPFWLQNYFLFRWPQLVPWLGNHYLRGAISGVGLVDLGIALYYLYRFRDVVARLDRHLALGRSGSSPAEGASAGDHSR